MSATKSTRNSSPKSADDQNKPAAPTPDIQSIAERILEENFLQMNLIEVALDNTGEVERMEALLKAIQRHNQAVFKLYQQLVGNAEGA